MFGRNKKRQVRVEITFRPIGEYNKPIPKEVIEIGTGQFFQTDIATDCLWEGDTLVKEFDWVAGYTRIYEYFYI